MRFEASLLMGLIFGPNGRAMSPSHTRRRGPIYRYYVTREAIADGYDSCTVTSAPAADVEGAVLDHIQKLLAAPELVARTWSTIERAHENEDDRTRGHSLYSPTSPRAARSCAATSSVLNYNVLSVLPGWSHALENRQLRPGRVQANRYLVCSFSYKFLHFHCCASRGKCFRTTDWRNSNGATTTGDLWAVAFASP